MSDNTGYTSNDYAYALDYAIDILEALDFENVLDRFVAKYYISVLQDIKANI